MTDIKEKTVPTENTVQPGRYQHYKGQEYRVFGVAQHSETLMPMVVYQPLYGEGALWVRPLSMFTESVELPDGKKVPRFKYISPVESPIPIPITT